MANGQRLVDRWFEDLFSNGDLAVADEILDAEVRYHGPSSLAPGDLTGRDAIKDYVEVYREAFPDLTYTVDRTFGADDTVGAIWEVVGTHERGLFGLQATGETFHQQGLNVFAVEDDRIVEVWSAWDTLKMVQELDILPPIGSLPG